MFKYIYIFLILERAFPHRHDASQQTIDVSRQLDYHGRAEELLRPTALFTTQGVFIVFTYLIRIILHSEKYVALTIEFLLFPL